MVIKVKAMRPELTGDFFRFFDEVAFADHPEWGCSCYCCFFHAASEAEWNARSAAENKESARQLIATGQLSGLLAYADGTPAGWCHFERKDSLPGLAVFYPQVLDEPGSGAPCDIAAIVCFTIAQGFRGQGLAGRLLDAACQELASQGFRKAEAYPMLADTSEEGNYHGPLSMYQSHGFTTVRTAGNMAIVQKTLS